VHREQLSRVLPGGVMTVYAGMGDDGYQHAFVNVAGSESARRLCGNVIAMNVEPPHGEAPVCMNCKVERERVRCA
jgi:hypothetical protein